ncbi:MAG: response regulator [Patescibacteria group bacterium]|jgi:DNA-binding response OmpR family regulator
MPTPKKILVVEDEKSMAKALELKLTKEGFVVEIAVDGEGALAKLRKEKYQLVLLDLVLPKLDGFGVLEAMKKEGIKTPAIVSTNLSQEEDEARTRALGAKDFFVKSDTSITDVVKHIKQLIG